MSTDVQKFFGGHNMPATKLSRENLANFAASKNALMGKALLRVGKTGEFVFGQDNEILPKGTKLIANPDSISTGYIAWWLGKPEGEIMQPLSRGPVDFNKLGPVNSGTVPPGKREASGRGWEDQVSVDLITEGDTPLQMTFKVSTLGGKKAIMELAADVLFAQDENPERIYPVVEPFVDSYIHPEYGEIFTPHFEITGWLGADGQAVVDKPKLGRNLV